MRSKPSVYIVLAGPLHNVDLFAYQGERLIKFLLLVSWDNVIIHHYFFNLDAEQPQDITSVEFSFLLFCKISILQRQKGFEC